MTQKEIEQLYKVYKDRNYQYDVIETLHDDNNCTLWNMYSLDKNEDTMILILDIANKKRLVMNDCQLHRDICFYKINEYVRKTR